MNRKYEAVVCGGSAGGYEALCTLLRELPSNYSLPILVVLHLGKGVGDYTPLSLDKLCQLKVKEGEDKEKILPGTVYVAPSDYHMLVEDDHTISLSVDEKVCFSRPSIDVLFESSADAYSDKLIGIVLSGANNDGSNGIRKIKQSGGRTIVQDPATARFDFMPNSAIDYLSNSNVWEKNGREKSGVDYVFSVVEIASILVSIQDANF